MREKTVIRNDYTSGMGKENILATQTIRCDLNAICGLFIQHGATLYHIQRSQTYEWWCMKFRGRWFFGFSFLLRPLRNERTSGLVAIAHCFQLQTHRLESDFSGLRRQKSSARVFKHCIIKKGGAPSTLSISRCPHHPLFSITFIPACTGAWQGSECRNNWAKCGENEEEQCNGAEGGGPSLGSDAASKSKLRRSGIFHQIRRWRRSHLSCGRMWTECLSNRQKVKKKVIIPEHIHNINT